MSDLVIMSGSPRPRGRGGPSLPSAIMAIRVYFNNGLGNNPLAGWQMKPELPTVNEIMGIDHPGEEFNLTTNQIHGPWSSTEQYLETHCNLLREDGVGNLRDAVAAFRERPGAFDNKDFVIYERVGRFITITESSRLAKYRLGGNRSSLLASPSHIGKSPFEPASPLGVRAKRSFGNILLVFLLERLLHCRRQTTCFRANVWLQLWQRGRLKVFPKALPKSIYSSPIPRIWTLILSSGIMIEARSGNYEAHRHTMTALQKLSRER